MSEIVVGPGTIVTQDPARIEADHYMTPIGGLASCPTGGAYWTILQNETPVEVQPSRIVGNAGRFTGRRWYAAEETRPSFDLLWLVGTSLAEEVVSVDTSSIRPARGSFEEPGSIRPGFVFSPLLRAVEIWSETLRVVERVEESPTHEDPGPRAWEAFKDLGEWLEVTDEEVAVSIGIGRTTVYSWQREDREPRRGTARKLFELHSSVRSLRRRLGADGLRAWLGAGEPTRRSLVLGGEPGAISAAVDSVVFSALSRPDMAAAPPDDGPVDPTPDAVVPQPRRRRPRRAGLR